MALFASLNGQRIVSAAISMSTYGAMSGDVVLATSTAIPTLCSLTIGNLTMACAVVRAASFTSSRTARIVGGFGGWRMPVKARGYSNPGGIRLSLVMRDVASDVGEQVVVSPDVTIGTAFVREAANASRVLRQLVGIQWWIDSAGVTHIGPRPAGSAITSDYLVNTYSGNEGRFTVSTEDLAAWTPGATFSNAVVTTPQTISNVSINMGKDSQLRVEVLAA